MTGVVPIRTYRKFAIERRRLYLDYSCWLEDEETLTEFQVTSDPYTEDMPIAVSSAYPDDEHKKLVLYVSGGVGNTNYTLSMVIRTDQGQVKRDDIGILVLP